MYQKLNYETIHVDNCEWVVNNGSDFIETVIDDWMMGETVNCNGWEGNLYIIKKELKNEPIQKNFGVGKLV